MRNIAFVIWMLGFPISTSLDFYLDTLSFGPKVYDDAVWAIGNLVSLVVWVWVGYLLYEKKST